jgi:glyceraldehyde 3-phosphate dehydrogenase
MAGRQSQGAEKEAEKEKKTEKKMRREMDREIKIAINGFGRIGRSFFRSAQSAGLEIVAINDLMSVEQLVYLLKYDSAYNRFSGEVAKNQQGILVEGKLIPILKEKDPAKLPWQDLAVDIVIESTGLFTDSVQAQAHIEAGAKEVIITAPASDQQKIKTIILGINEKEFKPGKDKIISMASCTTNCLTPVIKVLDENFGIEKSLFSTIHSYTSTQALQDGPSKKDFRRGRAAATNIIPTTTGASKATQLAYPKAGGKLAGLAFRVPTLTVSIIDLVALLKKEVQKEEINDIFKVATQQKSYQGLIGVTEEPLVSADFRNDPHGAIIDLPLTQVVDKNLVKIVAWYDNEMGYATRLVQLCKYLQGKL